MKRFIIIMIMILMVSVFATAESKETSNKEDFSKYTTEYLLEMKAAIEAELNNRNEKRAIVIDNAPIYLDENISVSIDRMIVDSNSVYASVWVSCTDHCSCLIIPNINEQLWTSVDGYIVIKKMKEIGSGEFSYFCGKGQSVLCDFKWDLDEIYDYPYFADGLISSLGIEPFAKHVLIASDNFPEIAGFSIIEEAEDRIKDLYDLIMLDEERDYSDIVKGVFNICFSGLNLE